MVFDIWKTSFACIYEVCEVLVYAVMMLHHKLWTHRVKTWYNYYIGDIGESPIETTWNMTFGYNGANLFVDSFSYIVGKYPWYKASKRKYMHFELKFKFFLKCNEDQCVGKPVKYCAIFGFQISLRRERSAFPAEATIYNL